MRAWPAIPSLALSAGLVLTAVGITAVPTLADDVIVVNSTGNAADASAGTGSCDVSAQAGSQCTLRAAIQTANNDPDQDTIRFRFSGTKVKTIKVPAVLPQLTQPVVIDGYSAANTHPNTKSVGSNARLRILLKGPGKESFDGLDLAAPSTIKGLVMQSFTSAIFISPGGEGSYISGNFIGTTTSGLGRARNWSDGIHVDCNAAVTIGGTSKAARNIIAAGPSSGVLLCDNVDGTKIKGNLIGVGADGKRDLGNSGPGILAFGTQDVVIGGDSKLARNTIAYNRVGVAVTMGVDDAQGVAILGNSFFRNDGLAIDLDDDGVTANDGAGDPDGGANHHQNYPQIQSAKVKGSKTVILGTMLGEPSSKYELRFFQDTFKEREGKAPLAKIAVTTNSAGKAGFTLRVRRLAPGSRVTATATNVTRSPAETSEFSFPKKVK